MGLVKGICEICQILVNTSKILEKPWFVMRVCYVMRPNVPIVSKPNPTFAMKTL